MEITAEFKQIAVPINENGLIPSLKEMAASFSSSIDRGGIGAVDKVHELTHIALWCFDEQVIAHEHITVKQVSVFVLSISQIRCKLLIVCFPKVDLPSLITPSGYVAEGTFLFNAQWPGHGCFQAQEKRRK